MNEYFKNNFFFSLIIYKTWGRPKKEKRKINFVEKSQKNQKIKKNNI